MKKSLKTIKFCLVLFALPIVATAAAAAHQQIVDTEAITIDVPAITAVESTGIERIHTVAVNENGAVEGRIQSLSGDAQGLAGLRVRFLQNGVVIKETYSGSDGMFIVSDISTGVYSFVASGANGFAAYSVNVVSDTEGKFGSFIQATAVSNVNSVEQILAEVKPSTTMAASKTTRELSVNGSSRVELKNGTLHGHLMVAQGSLEQTNVHILQGSEVVAVVKTDDSGDFMVKDLKPGIYDMVAAGPSGFAAFSLEAVAGPDKQTLVTSPSNMILVSTNPQGQDAFADSTIPATVNVYLVSPQDNVQNDDGFLPIEFASENVGLGGAGGSFGPQTFAPQTFSAPGGGGGGFGGFGGGGRAGRLLALAGLTVGIIAIADDNDPGAGSNPNP